MNRLHNKVALITGGTTGIGLETAGLFLAEGAKVILTGKNPERLAAVKNELPAAEVVAADAASLTDSARVVADIVKTHGRIDVLFLNAGVAQFAPFGELTEEFFDNQFNINIKGAFFQFQSAFPYLSKGASVIANASVVASHGMANANVYSASKAALVGLFRSLVAEESLQARGIRVNIVNPGPIATPIYDKLGMPKEMVEGFGAVMTSRNPSKRFGSPAEVAKAVLFLASDESSYLNGTDIAVDGGLIATAM
jgi:NAD(P)-dependent dehydrogenase (short-subunit alcohol dehydrogenase family)